MNALSAQKRISARERTLMPRKTPEINQNYKFLSKLEMFDCLFWILTKPGSHVNQDFDGGPLQASLILYKMKRKICTPSYPWQCFRQSTHWEERCHCQQHHRSMIPVSQAKLGWSWPSTCLLWFIFTFRIISSFLSSSYRNQERCSSEVVLCWSHSRELWPPQNLDTF